MLVPSNNAVIEPEFARMTLEGGAAFGARVVCGVESDTVELHPVLDIVFKL